MNKHTPAPWNICYDGQIDGNDGCTVCRFPWESYSEFQNNETWKANARLIAAAPELLAALQAVVRVADRSTVEFDLARDAIAKAQS